MSWPQVIADIQNRGLTLTQIAAICRCGQTTLSDLKAGRSREPAYALGESLMKLRAASDRAISRLRKSETTAA